MFKISDFSKLSHVSMRTLRYYDEISLLKPVLVDNQTGYRYYSVEQLTQLHRILELKGMGFELSQIVHLLQEDMKPEQLNHILELKLLEIQHQIDLEQERQLRVKTYLTQLQADGEQPAYEVILKKVDSLLVASSRTMVTNATSKQLFAQQTLDFLKENGVVQSDNFLFIDAEVNVDCRDDTVNLVEIAVPIKGSSIGNIVQRSEGRILIRELAGVNTMATVLHHGTPYTLMEAYQSLGTWIEANGYAITGPSRQVFLQRDSQPDTYLTEVQIPVDRKRK
jgi:Predicted transcriptional regulators